MKRYHDEINVMRRQQRVDRGPQVTSQRFKPLGKYRKKHALDCGHTRCGICHGHKRFGHEETRQERESELKLKEYL